MGHRIECGEGFAVSANLLTNLGAEFQTAAGTLRIPGSGLTSAKPGRYTPDQEGAMRIGSNGTVLATVRFAQSRKYRFTIRARGTEAAGEYPNIDVSWTAVAWATSCSVGPTGNSYTWKSKYRPGNTRSA